MCVNPIVREKNGGNGDMQCTVCKLGLFFSMHTAVYVIYQFQIF